MKINIGASNLLLNRVQNTNLAARTEVAGSFAATLADKVRETPNVTTSAADAKEVSFSNMTRREMFGWMNDQIRSGKMSLDESTPFLGMTMAISVATGLPVDMSTDNTRINFIEKARLGIEGASYRNDQDEANSLYAAIDIMLKNQGQTIGVDTSV